ncbi:hydantoinase/oxoprolinase family protein [Chelatococcus sp. YT9]|uniref:hydantoinase/oxoprolinase family protein n=1 Tax=Chelatococcus sp. YT9 TaxID=2835635 RepID=UPI001BD19A09|nr:hydantoinase/oxoprolinase family protein [Chelatococcus sp. YT9]MBS7701294.1 hydantoinase/oxoprolinase family protein [Chelatococcus sp. YT9]
MDTTLSIAIDVGGTFTDVVGMTDGGEMTLIKVPSTPANPSLGVVDGMTRLLGGTALTPANVTRFIHGTTVATNAVVEQKGAVTGLLTTEGFEDVLVIGRQKRSELYNLFIDAETPGFLAPRRRRIGIRERIAADGSILKPLDEDGVRAAVRELVESQGAEVISVCYLFSFLHPAHELRTKAIINEMYPHLPVSLSSAIDPTFREYERTLVTTFDAYVRPKVANYIDALEGKLTETGVPARLEIMQSRGGIAAARTAVERPVSLLRSGPAAGVVAAQMVGELCGEKNLISNDIGGTTADIGLVVDGKPLTSAEGKVLKYPLRIPMLDVVSIGAGGGSIAWLDEASSLHVGPQSAGSVPGPACYGQGGTEPTVTDASIVLGYLNADYFAGGHVKLDSSASHRVIETMGARLGMSKVRVAHGIHTILNNRMADEIRLLTIARGYDPREFALIVLGGAGPLHGSALARALRIPRVIVPFAPGVLSAFGLLVSDIEHDHTASFRQPATGLPFTELAEAFDRLDRAGRERMRQENIADARVGVRRYAEMRYVGQSYELEIPITASFDDALIDGLIAAFHEHHERVYRQRNPAAAVEFVNLRTVHFATVPKIRLEPPKPGPSWEKAQRGVRAVYLSDQDRHVDIPVYRRDQLPIGVRQAGPFIVEQLDSTTVVLPGETALVEPNGNIIVEMPTDA